MSCRKFAPSRRRVLHGWLVDGVLGYWERFGKGIFGQTERAGEAVAVVGAHGLNEMVEDVENTAPTGIGEFAEEELGQLGKGFGELAAGNDVGAAGGEVVGIGAFEEPGGGPPIAS